MTMPNQPFPDGLTLSHDIAEPPTCASERNQRASGRPASSADAELPPFHDTSQEMQGRGQRGTSKTDLSIVRANVVNAKRRQQAHVGGGIDGPENTERLPVAAGRSRAGRCRHPHPWLDRDVTSPDHQA